MFAAIRRADRMYAKIMRGVPMERRAMSKRALKRRSKAVVPALGITGLFLSLASGATADDEFNGDLTAS